MVVLIVHTLMGQMASGIWKNVKTKSSLFAKYPKVNRKLLEFENFFETRPHGFCQMQLFSGTSPSTNSKGYCVSGYEDVMPESDYCYKISTHKHGRYDDASELWSEAEMDCREHGAQLASFHSKVETMSVWQHWNPKTENGLWIGLIAYREYIIQAFF